MGLISIEDLANPKECFKMIKYGLKANYYARQTEKFRKQAAKEKEEKEKAEKEKKAERVEGEVVKPDKIRKFEALTNIVYNETKKRYEFTEPTDDMSMFYDENEVSVPFVEDIPELEDDDIENIISYVTKDVKRLNSGTDDNIIRNTSLAILFLTDMINSYQLNDHIAPNDYDAEDQITSIGKFLSGDDYKIFISANCYDISEFLTMKELKDIVNSIDTKLNWTGNQDYIDIVEAVRKGYTANKNKERMFAGEEPIDESPILFNNAILSTVAVDTETESVEPRINNKVKKYLIKVFTTILKEDKDFTFDILPATDNYNTNNRFRDVGQVIIKCVDNKDGSYCLYGIDLNNIVGNGYNLIIPSNFNGILQDIYVNIEKHPKLVRKILTTNYQFSFNSSNMNDLELKSVTADYFPYPIIYKYYDFSDMYKHLISMKEEDRIIFMNNLLGIINLNWYNINPGFEMPRFRFRDFTDARRFILVSDKNVRVQSSNWMSEPFSMFAKQFVNTDGYMTDDNELVVDLNNNDIRIFINKDEVNL